MKIITIHTNAHGDEYYSTLNENGEAIYSFSENFDDVWTQEDEDAGQSSKF
jgi:hypothetical protein